MVRRRCFFFGVLAGTTCHYNECGLGIVRGESVGSRVKTFVLTAKGQSAWDTCGQLVRKIEERWKTDFGVDIADKLREVLERVVGLGRGQFIGKAETLSRRWRSAKRRAFHTIQWRSTAEAFPMAVSGNAWLDRLGSLLDDGQLEVAIDKRYQGPACIETMAS
jgi:NADPH:quinone reductase-like Zn-dependent oxidoreductase